MIIDTAITELIIGSAIQIHRALGPGLLESVYKSCLLNELQNAGLSVEKEIPVPVIYKGVKLDCGYRADLIINKNVLVEIKSVECLNDIHKAQVLTYLRLSDLKIGLLINFNVIILKDGVKRIVNNY